MVHRSEQLVEVEGKGRGIVQIVYKIVWRVLEDCGYHGGRRWSSSEESYIRKELWCRPIFRAHVHEMAHSVWVFQGGAKETLLSTAPRKAKAE